MGRLNITRKLFAPAVVWLITSLVLATPVLQTGDIEKEFAVKWGRSLRDTLKFDAVVVTAADSSFKSLGGLDLRALIGTAPVLLDIPGLFAQKDLGKAGLCYLTL
jgi:hypothetical protein